MEKSYNYKKVEHRINSVWEKSNIFFPKIDNTKKPFSIFLVPPNASGPMHIGNALMVAMQDILVRYHRASGDPTLWIPCTDHGGYETQVSFEKLMEKNSKDKNDYSKKELFEETKKFVENNNDTIKSQLKMLGASVDWTRFRFTMDKESLLVVDQTFKKMVSDNLIYRRLYMVNYCSSCATFLADIELKKVEEKIPLYFVRFDIKDSEDDLVLATEHPEFLFTVTHVLVHPADKRYSDYIGKVLLNPITGQPVEIIASKRKLDPENMEPFLSPFCPSFKKYDYEYTLRNSIPSRNLIDWDGNMIERYPGIKPSEARQKEISFLEKSGRVERVDYSHEEEISLCKSGHKTESVIMFTWFLRLDDKKVPLRKPAIDAIEKENLAIFPRWRKKGLVEWMGKMHDWPIARQSVWGIKIPIWYDVSDSEKFTVWFIDKQGKKFYGGLKYFLDQGVSLQEISDGLERVYASQDAKWSLDKELGKPYLPETDTFDTWFSSGQWGNIVFGNLNSKDFFYFYPSDSIIIGHDLLRLSISRKIFLSFYITKRLPFKCVYLHPLLKGKDGQKMSKSIGNVVSLEHYLENFGADVTRMALISYLSSQKDFVFSEERLEFFHEFSHRLWQIGQVVNLTGDYAIGNQKNQDLPAEDKAILSKTENIAIEVGYCLKKYLFADAQEKLYNFLSDLEEFVFLIQSQKNLRTSIPVLQSVFKKYLIILHPFAPFITEELYEKLYKFSPLASVPWPK